MAQLATFDDILDAAEALSPEAQADLVAVIRRRLADRDRQRLVSDVRQSQAEHERGEGKATSVDDLMREITE